LDGLSYYDPLQFCIACGEISFLTVVIYYYRECVTLPGQVCHFVLRSRFVVFLLAIVHVFISFVVVVRPGFYFKTIETQLFKGSRITLSISDYEAVVFGGCIVL
jgi:hypothetical protein